MKRLSLYAAAMLLLPAAALALDATAIRAALLSAPAAELPALAASLVAQAAPRDAAQTRVLILKTVAMQRNGALPAVAAALRPPVTPGNEHGNRPTVPPGLEKRDYGRP